MKPARLPALASLLAIVCLAFTASRSRAQEESRNYPLGPIGGQFRVTPGSNAARVVAMPVGSPGHNAGLRVDDYIYGAFGKPFTPTGQMHYGFTQDLGFAIDRAEAGDGILPLMVLRPGIGAITLHPQLAAAGAFGPAYPLNSPKFDGMYESAVAHLHQQATNANGNLGYFTGWTGLCLLGHPDWNQNAGPRPYRNSINLIRDHVVATLNNANYAPNENLIILADGTTAENPNHQGGMSNWQLGQMVMFLAEYFVKTNDSNVSATLQRGAELCANTVQWWKQPALAGNGYSPEHNHVKGMVSHGGVTGDYIHLGWGGGINMCGVYSFNGLAFARRAGMNMAARPRDGHDFGYDSYPDTLMPVVPEHLKGYNHTLEEKFMYQWDFMGRRSMTRSPGNWGDGHIWYLAGQGSTTWDAGGRSPGTLLGIAMYQQDVGDLNADDLDRLDRIKGYITRAYMWQQEAHAYCVGAQAYHALATAYLSDRQLRYVMDNWRFFHALARTSTGGFQYVRARSTNDSYLDETRCAAINTALPHAIAHGRLALVPGFNTARLLVRFDHPDMTWPALEARQLKTADTTASIPFAVCDGEGRPLDPSTYTATWKKLSAELAEPFGSAATFTDEAFQLFNQNHPPDASSLPSSGHGNYRGFSFQPGDSTLKTSGGSAQAPELRLNSLTLRRSATAGSTGAGAVYLKVYSSQSPSTTTWIGDSSNTADLRGGISEGNVTFTFNSLPLQPSTRYFFYLANTAGNLATGSITWNTGRLRVSNTSGHTYPSGNLINTSWGNADTAFDALFTAAIAARSYEAPASAGDSFPLTPDRSQRIELHITSSTHSAVEPIDILVEAPPAEPPPMAILTQPQAASTTLGGSVQLSLTTTGPSPQLFQWRRNGQPIGSPSPNPTLSLANVSGGAAGEYDCVYTTTLGTLTSTTATVTLSDAGAIAPGGLWREVFTGIGGNSIANLTENPKFPFFADSSGILTSASSPSNFADSYGQRWTGWITPQNSGNHRFYLASDDDSELWLGTSESPASATRILQLSGYTGEKQWSARSPSTWIPLLAGKRYYFEVRHKDGGGADHCAVAWQLQGDPNPVNGSGEIPGSVLSHRVGGLYQDTSLPNSPPTFAQSLHTLPAATALVAYSASATGLASDPDPGDSLTYRKLAGPAWLSIAPDGSLSGTPGSTDAGEKSFTLEASDSGNLTATTTLSITVSAADFHFDANGPLAGSGAAAGGSWDNAPLWSADPNGNSATFPWIEGAHAIFSAGNDASGPHTITLSGTKTFGAITFRSGSPLLSGGSLVPATAATPLAITTTSARIDSPLSGGNRGIVKTGPGLLTLGASNTFTGDLRITQGTLELAPAGKLYNAGFNNTSVITVETTGTWRLPDYSYGGVGQLADYRQRRILDGGTIEVTGNSHSSGQDFTVGTQGGTFRYSPSGQTLTLAGNNNTNIRLEGPLTFDTPGTISITGSSAILEGPGDLLKTGPGTLLLGNAGNSFSGNLTAHNGLLRATSSTGSATTSTLGAKSSTRSITLHAPASMEWTANNILGGGTMSASSLPAVSLNGASFTTTRFNPLGNLTLSAASLINANATDPATYDGFQFLGTVTATGTTPSSLTTTTGRGNHLLGGGETEFSVTHSAGLLTIATTLRNGSNDYPGIAALRKSGPGTLSLTAANSYTGPTTVEAGTLLLAGSLAGPATVQTGATLSGSGSLSGTLRIHPDATLEPSPAVTLTAGALVMDPSATLAISLNTPTPGRIHSTANASLDGARLLLSGTPPNQNPILLLTCAGTRSGNFDTANSSLPSGWEITYTDDSSPAAIYLTPVTSPADPFTDWIESHPTGGLHSFTDDPDHDGIPNGIEFLLHGGDPLAPHSATLPALANDAHGTPHFTFRRAARARNHAVVHIELSDDLLSWPEHRRLHVGETTATSSPGVTITPHADHDEISIALPTGTPQTFARLRATLSP